ncbi:hypothetical protein CHGG_10990 [Chaetomium globosum CBS 148.51]|uniref:Reverse transcriptase domain-containing protein n=1 Tax=Chaetomium globosum (strain ATCC 6205 / CBS 148.51 / DSM 1962 / NBRC 6347 / NRRL 1970) TaxID=306901 RepID=Q2GM14_CHAGB|nr:uncharacterized protein CHGG_10990 [Chaetomium globosum CBS 148.51]EAQ83172.1 hypothetical protein CHGG_10990 [Chaetomium globosum CBS 148.51]
MRSTQALIVGTTSARQRAPTYSLEATSFNTRVWRWPRPGNIGSPCVQGRSSLKPWSSMAVTPAEITRAIGGASPWKAPGEDLLPIDLLKACGAPLAEVLAVLATRCLELGWFPNRFKRAKTVVLPKPGKAPPVYQTPGGYRPIALLPTLGKLIESVVATKVTLAAEANGLLPDEQMGNRAHRSTELAVRLVVAQVQEAWRQKGAASLLQLDILGAFDTVNHTRLLATLREMGYPRWLVLWIRDWLTGREATLLFDGKAATPTAIRAGVPQGSPLSPVLFILYIASLYKQLKDKHPHLAIVGRVCQIPGSLAGLETQLESSPGGGGKEAEDPELRPVEDRGKDVGNGASQSTRSIHKVHPVGAGLWRIIVSHPHGCGRRAGKERHHQGPREGPEQELAVRNLETETWVPPLDLYLNKRLADFENRLQQPDLDDGQGGKKTAGNVVLTACRKIQQRLSSTRGNRGRPRTLGPQGPTAVERAAATIMRWTGGTVDTNRVVEEAWKARWLKERDGRAFTRSADDFDHQQETLFRNETLRRHDGLSKAKSSLLTQIRTGAIGLRDFLFTREVPEVLTPACECGEGRETAEHLVVWCLAPPLTRRWERTGIRTRRDFYSVLHGINPTTARLARRVLDWLMDSGKLPMYNLARAADVQLSQEARAGSGGLKRPRSEARRPPLFVYVGPLKRIAP